MIIVLMGVAGSGKTTIGQQLAARLGCGFADADSFHPPENVEKMRAGVPLSDEDRWPWLAALRASIDGWAAAGESHVVACSALRQVYRDALSPGKDRISSKNDLIFVYLKGTPEVIGPRLSARQGHYMNLALLESQFATLEEPRDAIVVNIGRSVDMIVEDILFRLPNTGPRL